MAVRATKNLSNCLIVTKTVAAGQSATKGKRLKFAAVDTEVQTCGANEAGIGTALTDAVAGADVQIALDGYAIVPVLVGTGGATRGSFAVTKADGYADQVIADGTTPRFFAGVFMQTGVAGDIVGMMVGVPTPCSTA